MAWRSLAHQRPSAGRQAGPRSAARDAARAPIRQGSRPASGGPRPWLRRSSLTCLGTLGPRFLPRTRPASTRSVRLQRVCPFGALGSRRGLGRRPHESSLRVLGRSARAERRRVAEPGDRFESRLGTRPKRRDVPRRPVGSRDAPSRTRTCDRRLRRPMLYPAELWERGRPVIHPIPKRQRPRVCQSWDGRRRGRGSRTGRRADRRLGRDRSDGQGLWVVMQAMVSANFFASPLLASPLWNASAPFITRNALIGCVSMAASSSLRVSGTS